MAKLREIEKAAQAVVDNKAVMLKTGDPYYKEYAKVMSTITALAAALEGE